MRRQGDLLTRVTVVALILAAALAIPSARLIPAFAVAFWGAAIVLAVAAAVMVAVHRSRASSR